MKWALCFPCPSGSKNGAVLYHVTDPLQTTYFISKSLAEGDNLKEGFFRRQENDKNTYDMSSSRALQHECDYMEG